MGFIALLGLVAFVTGLIGLFKGSVRWLGIHNRKRAALVLFVGVLLIAVTGAGPVEEDGTGSPGEGEQEVASETSAPEPETELEQLEAIVKSILKGNNNRKVPYFRAVEIQPDDDGGWIVLADMNAAGGSSVGRIRDAIESKMFELHKALYTSELDVRMVSIKAYLPYEDKYANVIDTMVYQTVLLIDDARRINWARMTPDQMQGIWTVGAPVEFRP